jgi:hypothetical protein
MAQQYAQACRGCAASAGQRGAVAWPWPVGERSSGRQKWLREVFISAGVCSTRRAMLYRRIRTVAPEIVQTPSQSFWGKQTHERNPLGPHNPRFRQASARIYRCEGANKSWAQNYHNGVCLRKRMMLCQNSLGTRSSASAAVLANLLHTRPTLRPEGTIPEHTTGQ